MKATLRVCLSEVGLWKEGGGRASLHCLFLGAGENAAPPSPGEPKKKNRPPGAAGDPKNPEKKSPRGGWQPLTSPA